MTIVIGLMAETRQSKDPSIPDTAHLFLCADTMATYATLGGVAITSHQSQGKIYELPQGFFLAFSDDYYWSHLIASEIYGRLLSVDFSSNAVKDLIKVEVQASFQYAYTWYRDEVLRQELGITTDEYLNSATLAPELRRKGLEVLRGKAQEVPAEVIIAGQTHRGPVLLKANACEIRETTEFHVTGAAADSAISWLRLRDQRNNMSAARSFYHMIEAKRFAQLDPTVGRKTQIVYIPPTGQSRIFADDGVHTMKDWMKICFIKSTAKMDSKIIRKKFEKEIERTAITRK